jgi:hypothetical protein
MYSRRPGRISDSLYSKPIVEFSPVLRKSGSLTRKLEALTPTAVVRLEPIDRLLHTLRRGAVGVDAGRHAVVDQCVAVT